MDTLKQELREFVVSNFLFGQDNGMPADASFLEFGVVDSTGVMEMVAHLQKRYQVKVEDNELTPQNLDSIDALAAYISRKRQAASSSTQ